MDETSVSLLESLRSQSDGNSWQRLVELYTPMIRRWLSRHFVRDQDAEDIAQEVLTVVVRRIRDFQRQDRTGAFRSWLRSITVNCLRSHWRKQQRHSDGTGGSEFQVMLQQLEDPDSDLTKLWDEEHDRYVTHSLFQKIRPSFSDSTWLAFRRTAIDGASPTDVAADLGITVNAVSIAKSRVLTKFRHLAAGLID